MKKGSAGCPIARSPRRTHGFTLIELMIVVAVVSILAMLAYPAYQDHVRKSRRADGKGMLLDAAARMERYYFDENTYSTDLTELGYGVADNAPSSEGYWTLSTAAGPTGDIATSFALTASLAAGFDDPQCTSLTLNSRGEKSSAGTADAQTCWR